MNSKAVGNFREVNSNPVKRRRIRTVISNLILIAGHVTEHARQVVLALGCSNVWRHTFMDLYRQLVLA